MANGRLYTAVFPTKEEARKLNLDENDVPAASKLVNINSEENLCLLHLNIQGLHKKVNELEILLNNYNIDIFCISEHHLKNTEISCINFSNYYLVNSFCRDNHEKGGVCIFAKNNIEVKPLGYHKFNIEKTIEITACQCKTELDTFQIICVYRSPKANTKTELDIFFSNLYDIISGLYKPNAKIILAGDININLLQDNTNSRQITNIFNEFGMKNIISEPTRTTEASSTLIDVIFTNCLYNDILIQETYLSDHSFQVVKLSVKSGSNNDKGSFTFKRDLSNSNINTFKTCMKNETWSDARTASDFHSSFKLFYNSFLFHFNSSFPLKKIRSRNEQPKWINNNLKNMHTILCDLSKLSKTTKNEIIKTRYTKFKTIYKTLVVRTKKTYNDKRILNSKNIVKESWKVVNEMKVGKLKTIPNEMVHNENIITGLKNICNHFNLYFTNMEYPTPDSENPKLPEILPTTFFLTPTTPEEVERIMMKTTTKNSAGPDEINGTVLKSVNKDISTILSDLINDSFLYGCYPDELKLSKSIPIYKNKGPKDDFNNYRNVCMQNQIAKIFETAFNDRLVKFLETHSILNDYQHGFRKAKSTSTALAGLCSFIYESLNEKEHTIALLFDLSQAFNSIDHTLLLEKLWRIGIRGLAYDWIDSYLKNREQKVVIENEHSDTVKVRLGVPQGSILGPILFLIFINDLPLYCSTPDTEIIYADDTNFAIKASNTKELIKKANICADEFSSYCKSQGLLVNVTKSKCITFLPKNISPNLSCLIKLEKRSIEQVNCVKFLGVILDEKLTWEPHINMICQKLSKVCFLIRNIKNTVSFEVLKLIYFGLVESTLSYGLIFWGASAHLQRAFISQKKIIKCIVGVSLQTSCKPLFIQMKILTLPCLYIFYLVTNVKKNHCLYTLNSDIHSHNTRNKNKIHQPFSRLSLGQNSFDYKGIICYNKIVTKIGNMENPNSFKNNVKTYLLSNPFYSLDEFLNA